MNKVPNKQKQSSIARFLIAAKQKQLASQDEVKIYYLEVYFLNKIGHLQGTVSLQFTCIYLPIYGSKYGYIIYLSLKLFIF